MLQRYQVLLTDWQVNYIKMVAERYDLSFSEIMRIFLCAGFAFIIPLLHPEYQLEISKKQILKMIQRMSNSHASLEQRHQTVSKVYFEARKLVEYRTGRIKKRRKLRKS